MPLENTVLDDLKGMLDSLVTLWLVAGEDENEHISMINEAGINITTKEGCVAMLSSRMIASLLELLAQAYNNIDDGEEETTALELWQTGKTNT